MTRHDLRARQHCRAACRERHATARRRVARREVWPGTAPGCAGWTATVRGGLTKAGTTAAPGVGKKKRSRRGGGGGSSTNSRGRGGRKNTGGGGGGS
jgi:hypothetical protein